MKIDQITFTRFLAALSIVVFHYGVSVSPFSLPQISFLFERANIGVSYFFILSGFIMVISYGEKPKVDFGNYMKNRFARIYPLYFLSLLLVFACTVYRNNLDMKGLLLNLAMIQAWFPGMALSHNPPAWSLSVELFFYLIFPFAFNYFYKKKSESFLSVTIIAFWLLSQIVFLSLLNSDFNKGVGSKSHEFLAYFPVMHLNQFLIGNLAGLFFLKHRERFTGNFDFAIVIFVTLLVLALRFPFGLNYHNGLLAVVFIPLIVFMSGNTGKITSVFSRKPLVFLDEISYGVYILQFPVFLFLTNFSFYNATLTFFIKLAILLFLSGVSYLYIETPLRNRIKMAFRQKKLS